MDDSDKAVLFMKLAMGDNSPPVVSFTSPASIEDDFELNRKITIVFNENVQSLVETPIQLTLEGENVSGKWAILENCMVFTPDNELALNSTYNVLIYGLEDKNGNRMLGVYQYKFQTGSRRDTTPIQVKDTYPLRDATMWNSIKK